MPTQIVKPKHHLVVLSGNNWGHIISFVQTGLKILSLSPDVNMTLLAAGEGYPKVQQEVEKQHHLTPTMRARIQVLECADGKGVDPAKDGEEFEDPARKHLPGAAWAWMDLCGSGESKIGDKWRVKPSLILYDPRVIDAITTVRLLESMHGLSYTPALLVCGVPTGGKLICGLIADEEGHGTYAGIKKRYEKALASGMTEDQAANKAYFGDEGVLIEQPDLPPMYDYEFMPQVMSKQWPVALVMLMHHMGRVESIEDGMVTFGVRELEEWAAAETERVMGPKRKLFPIGFQLSKEQWYEDHPSRRTKYNEEERKSIDFLDRMEKAHGKRSVAFLSFGTVSWPAWRPELMSYLVETLLAMDPPIPFLFAAAAANATISDELQERAKSSGLGVFVKWAPQNTVLQHDAIRFFVSHCGSGSTIESMTANVPIVGFPFINDQVHWARHLSEKYHAGIELHQVKSGMKGRPLGIGGTVTEDPEDIKREMTAAWVAMRDPAKYEEFRRNMAKLKDAIEESGERGEGRKALEELMRTYLA